MNNYTKNFQPMVKSVREIFSKNLLAVFVHGSVFDGTFGPFSDYDIVIILKHLDANVLKRDPFAQQLKKKLLNKWQYNPFSFDFYTAQEIINSARLGHPFVASIIKKGMPIYDPTSLFDKCASQFKDVSPDVRIQMSKNFLFLSEKYIKSASILIENGAGQFALLHAITAISLIIRSFLIIRGMNIYQGEIFQFFMREFKNELPKTTKEKMWKYAFPANQMAFRLKEPHVDVPLQDAKSIYKNIKNEDLVKKLITLYNELKSTIE